MDAAQPWSTVFYAAPSERIPAQEWLDEQDQEVQERAVALLQVLRDQSGHLGMPHVRHLRGKIWELRLKARSGDYRVLYATVSERRILVLHGFQKTTKQTPARDLRTAEGRLDDFLRQGAAISKESRSSKGGD